jgi:4-amino-4-deoxy-L-arabinose transferase-like glycosyltransferase
VRLAQSSSAPAHRVKPSWHRLLGGLFGRDDGWLLPAVLIAAAGVLWDRRRASRRDPLRAAVMLWGIWLATMFAFFSASGYPNSYYVAALSPAIGGLCGAGLALMWQRRRQPAARGCLAAALLACVGYGVYLLDGGTAVPGWLAPLAVCLAILSTGALAFLASGPASGIADRRIHDRAGTATALAIVCALLLPGVASALMAIRGHGPFAAPYQPASASASRASAQQGRLRDEQIVAQISANYGTPIPFATDSSILAAPYILATGREILPIGGFQGGAPAPSLARVQRYISSGELRAFIVPVSSQDPRILWIHAHCTPASGATQGKALVAVYDCGTQR